MPWSRLFLSLLMLACRDPKEEGEEGLGDSASSEGEGSEGGAEGDSGDSGAGGGVEGGIGDSGADGASGDSGGTDGAGADGSSDGGSVDSGSTDGSGLDGGADSGTPGAEPGCVAYGLTLADQAALLYGAFVDSYASSAGPYDAGAAGEAATLAVGGADACDLRLGGELHGDVYVSDSAAGVYCEEWGVELSGSVLELPEALDAPAYAVPVDLPTSEGDLWVGYGEELALEADATHGALGLGSGSRLVVNRSSRLLVQDLTVDDASLEIAPGEVLRLYVLGDLELNWGSFINVGGEPGQLEVVMVGGGALALRNGAELVARVYAPESAMGHHGTFSGALLAQSLEMNWGAQTHVDIDSICP